MSEERLKRVINSVAIDAADNVLDDVEHELGRILDNEEWERAHASIVQGIEDAWPDIPHA